MKLDHLRLPLTALAVLWLGLAALLWATFDQLPQRVATHFAAGGYPNGWMTRATHVQVLMGLAIGLPIFLHGILALIRRSGGVGCNIPHRDYWLSPERSAETLAYVQRQGAWFVCATVAFFAGMHYVVLEANKQTPVMLPGAVLACVAGTYLVLTGAWLVFLLRRFSRLPDTCL